MPILKWIVDVKTQLSKFRKPFSQKKNKSIRVGPFHNSLQSKIRRIRNMVLKLKNSNCEETQKLNL